jgi:hypothetical protein
MKMNMDGSFVGLQGLVSSHAVDCTGSVVFTAWRVVLFRCAGAAEAEALACAEGIRLAHNGVMNRS